MSKGVILIVGYCSALTHMKPKLQIFSINLDSHFLEMTVMYGDSLVFEDVAYFFSEDTKNEADAQATCEAKHNFGRLVEITSRQEMSFLMGIAYQKDRNAGDYFIGRFREQPEMKILCTLESGDSINTTISKIRLCPVNPTFELIK